MEGFTGNYSGASYPPSMYDTSVSSASASRRNAAPLHREYSEREEPRFMIPNQYPHEHLHHHPQRGQSSNMYSRSPRSFDNPRYNYNRDITAMSDPGAALPEQHYGQHRSHVEYAQSEIASPTGMYYEPQQQPQQQQQQQRVQKPMRYFEEERHANSKHAYSQNRYSSSPSPRKSRSPPLEQQAIEEPMLRQMYSGDGEFTSREKYTRGNEVYQDGMYKSSPSYNRRSPDSSNVKEFQRQLWNTKARDASPPRNNRRIQQSLSPERRHQGTPTSSNNLSRFARSLSPRRRQYQQSSPIANESPSRIQKASSTMSDTSYNSRFHSKFVEAALMAQQRGDNDKDHEVDDLQKHPIRQYQQQQGHESFSSRPLDDSKEHRYIPKSSPMPYTTSNQNKNGETRKNVPQYHKNDTYVQTSRSGNETRRPPTIPPSPSSSSSPAATSNGRHQQQQQKHFVSMDRGKESPQFRKSDGSARRIRPPSPLLLDRIKSFDQEYYNDSTRAVSDVREQQRYGRHDEPPVPNGDWHGMNYHDNDSNNNSHQVAGSSSNNNNMRSQYIANEEDMRRPHPGRFENERKSYDARKSHQSQLSSPSVNRQNHQQNEMQASRDFGGQIDHDRMAYLVDKLSAVNRENPQSALAQIDSILREESRSRSSHTKSFENSNGSNNSKSKLQQSHNDYPTVRSDYEENGEANNPNNNDEEEEEDDDDESSDVSSITNPTFQPGTSRTNYAKNAESLYIRENDHYNMHSAAPSNNLGFNPSTSSFRRPRPSHLQNYTNNNDISKDPTTMSRTEWKRQQIKQFPPPSTIRVKDDQDTTESPRQNSADVRDMMLQKNRNSEASRATKNKKVTREPSRERSGEPSRELQKPKPKAVKPKKKLDTFMSDKEELADKIRGWDEMSNQLSTSRSQNEDKMEVRQNIAAFSKPHPWDSRAIQTKDTSMENADGVEASISMRTHQYGSYMRELDVDAELSVGGSRVGNKSQGNHFERARRKIKDRSADTNPFNGQSAESNEKDTHARLVSPGFPDIDLDDTNAMPNVEVSMNGIPQFNPSGSSSGRDRDEKKSDVDGSSWVEMPPSSFFPDVNDNYQPTKPSRKPSAVSSPLVTTGGQLKLQNRNGLNDPRSITRLACKTVSPKEPKTKEKKRGFLQKFMEKKKGKSRSIGYTASASAGSMSGHSVSVESRGVKSASYVQTSSSRPNNSDAMPRASNFQILAAPPGVLATGKNAPRGRTDNRNATSASPRRGRSKSSDNKFRSNSMAQKFNRVMQLYDSDET